MKILVTGGAGFIASHVVDALVLDGHEVAVVDNLSTGNVKNLNAKIKFYNVDICNYDALDVIFSEFKPDIINHHAAQMDVRVSIRDPIKDANINIIGSLNIIKLATEYQVKKLIYISTGGAVYGEPLYLPVDENHMLNPISQYGISKHTVEHYLYLYQKNFGLNSVILRYPNVYGPRQNPLGEAGVIAIFALNILNGNRPIIFGDGKQTRDYVYIEDIVQANLNAISTNSTGIINIGSGKGTTVLEINRILCEILNSKLIPIFEPQRVGEIKSIYLNSSKANELLNWSAKTSLFDGLVMTTNWITSNLIQFK
ncbi:NAD-dependent epimerase/dehydratase family protein [Lysinibacillus sp. NPDC097231]|uniref:NAD-dependent epimerase/dehydratase family protein n=1 Tax=Lysinibacillus sp. NPDC097231 TaxID=3364142 RepID=UPI0038005488